MREMILTQITGRLCTGRNKLSPLARQVARRSQRAIEWAVASDKSAVARAMYQGHDNGRAPQAPRDKDASNHALSLGRLDRPAPGCF